MLAIALAALAAYHNSFNTPPVFDDRNWIVDNPTIRDLSRPADVLVPADAALHGGRPLLNLTLAINYALSEDDYRWYHAVNVAIHVLTALALFGLMRRTLRLPSLGDRFAGAATPLAMAVALLWVVHPLCSESVTYLVQRSESLAALFCLLTLYCVVRGATAGSRRALMWYAVSAVCCWLGAAAKEWIVVTPFVAVLLDRALLAGSFRKALALRSGLYLALITSWGIVAWELYSTDFHNGTTGVGVRQFTPLSYLATEPGVVLHYLWQAVWPQDLSIDWGWPAAGGWPGVAAALAMLAIIALVGWALVKRPALGALAVAPLLVLAPTSSFAPLADSAAERRMYLPLAFFIALVVIGAYLAAKAILAKRQAKAVVDRSGRTIALGVLALASLIAVPLTFRTIARNNNYRSEEALWADAVATCPWNPRARYNYGCQLTAAGRHGRAIEQYQAAIKADPRYAFAHHNLATELALVHDFDGAITHERLAIQANPAVTDGYHSLGLALEKAGRPNEAARAYQTAMTQAPADFEVLNDYGQLLSRLGKPAEAVALLDKAIQQRPRSAKAHYNLAAALLPQGKLDEAQRELDYVLAIEPRHVGAHADLSGILILRQEYDSAIEHCRAAVEASGSADDRPMTAVAESNWGSALDAQGKWADAIAHWRKAVELRPTDAAVLNHLAWALATNRDPLLRDGLDAVLHARLAAELTGGKDPTILATFAAAQAEAGRYPQAVEIAERALELAHAQHNAALTESLRGQIELYQTGQAYHEK